MYTVVPHQVVRLKDVQPCHLQYSELFELWYIDFRGEQYYIENDNFTPVGIAVKFDLMLIDEYNDSENCVAVVRRPKPKCTCPCHEEGVTIMHCFPCC
jgi:hypothetical protein